MKKVTFIFLPSMLFLASCGGSSETTESTESNKDSVAVEKTIEYGPLKTTEEVRESAVIATLADFNATADKSTVIRYVSSEYNQPFPTELLDAYNLQVLSLNSMTGELPAEMGTFKNLTTLVIGGDITTLPESIGELQNLKAVSFEYCKSLDINQALTVLAKCPNLQYLNLSYMGLTELPASIGDLKSLKHLRLGNNPLTTLPESLYSLPALEHLRIGSNEGLDYNAVLTSAKALPALSTLWIQYCGFTALPKVLGEYPALKTIHWREEWKDKNADQIIAICEKENKKFANLEITWDSMSGMFYDIY